MTTATSSSFRRSRRAVTVAARLIAVAGLAVALSACKTMQVDKHVIVGSVPDDYRTTHPIAIDESIETIDIPVGLNTGKLSAGAKANVHGFAQKFVDSGSSLLAIVAPEGSPNAPVAASVAYQIKDVLVASGVSSKAIELRAYRAEAGETSAPVRVAYAAITAKTAPCGPWPDQMARNPENRHYFNYGCASQQNLAAIVANPLDLLYPRAMTPPDATRRAEVLKNYGTGAPFQSDYSLEVGADEVAQGVGN